MNKKRNLYFICLSFFSSIAVYHMLPLFSTINVESIWHLETQGVHVHHYAWGVVIMTLTGLVAFMGYQWYGIIPLIFGYGLFLTFDELAMWLLLIENDHGHSLEYVGLACISVLLIAFLLKKDSGP